MLSIPTIVFVDWMLHDIVPSVYKIVGTLVVALGFLLVNLDFECLPGANDLCFLYCPSFCHPLCCCYRAETETPTEEDSCPITPTATPFPSGFGNGTKEGRELMAAYVGINYASTTDGPSDTESFLK
jgi:hypothetical protein